jgi:ABC-2 type transport system permease protein
VNLFTDAIVQPFLTAMIEVALWSAILAATGSGTLAGYSRESYLAYALWAAFFARTSANWMYEMRMIDEIDTGTVNSVLARPISFYEYYLAQFMGYKILTTGFSFLVPIVIVMLVGGDTHLARLPAATLLAFYYLILVYTISFGMSSLSFFFNRVHSFAVAKNIALWMVTGELFPLDMVPEPYRQWVMDLPFSSAVYVPVGYVTGRIGHQQFLHGFVSVTIGLMVSGFFSMLLWNAGRRRYSGTGA